MRYAFCWESVLAVWITTTRWKKLGGNFDQVLDITLVSVARRHRRCTHLSHHHHAGTFLRTEWRLGGDVPHLEWRTWHLGRRAAWSAGRMGMVSGTSIIRWPCWLTPSPRDCWWRRLLGVLGNWFNQELYGAPTTLPWGLKLNMEGTAIGHSETML